MRAATIIPVMLLACSGFAHSALAQGYAGQDGRALERDLRRTPGPAQGLTPRLNMMDEVRRRNALVTGDVGGLRSFHGSAGYTAPSDFRGSLASDSTYSFVRDSSSAGQFTKPFRGADALRYQLQSTTGMTETSRLGATGASAAAAAPGQAANSSRAMDNIGALRSTASFDALRDLNAGTVGYEAIDRAYRPVMASSLLGIRSPLRAPLTSEPLTPWRTPSRREGEETQRPGLTQPLSTTLSPLTNKDQNVTENKATTRTIYDDLRERLNQQVKTKIENPDLQQTAPTENLSDKPSQTKPPENEVDRRLQELRDRLVPKNSRTLRPEGGLRGPGTTGLREGTLRNGEAQPDDKKKLDDETIDLIRRAGGTTSSLTGESTGPHDAYTEHMTEGQHLLGQGKYFDAEERFARALSAKEGDVTAMVGRLHAQVGAGLYLSAAVNLRQLISTHPEVTALRFTGPTVPPAGRLASVAAEIRGNIRRAQDNHATPNAEESLLLAYLGWQLGDRATSQQGLAQAKDSFTQAGADAQGTKESLTLIELLEKVWLSDAPAPTPTEPAPTSAPAPSPTPNK